MPEQQNIEYKQTWRDEYLKWICGFANAQGGKLYIGMDDDGNVTGVESYKKLLDEIPNKVLSRLGGINERQVKAVLYVREHGSINNAKYQELNNLGKSATTTELQDLVSKNLIVQTGSAGRGINYILPFT
jgi:ATP-dependent DNA helicase RecG